MFEITGYNYPDPNTTGNQLELTLTIKRYPPYTGTKVLVVGAVDPLAGSDLQYNTPWGGPTGDWAYSSGPAADFTVPTTLSAATVSGAAGYVDLTLTPVGAPPGLVTLGTAEVGVTFTPLSLTLSTMAAQTVRVNLPARTASYGFTVSAQAGGNAAKTVGVNVSVAAPSITLTLGTAPPVYAGAAAAMPVSLTSSGWNGVVSLTCLSTVPGVYCPSGQTATLSGGTGSAVLAVATSLDTPNGASVTVLATPVGVGAPGPKSVAASLAMVTGFTLQGPGSTVTLYQNVPGSADVVIRPSGGFAGPVSFSCPSVAGLSCSGTATVVGTSAVTARVALSGTAPVVLRSVVLQGTGMASNTVAMNVEVRATLVAPIVEPTPSSSIPQASEGHNAVTFRWGAGLNATSYRLRVTDSGGTVYDGTTTNLFSDAVTVKPSNCGGCSYGALSNWTVRLTSFNGAAELGTVEATYPIVGALYPARNFEPAATSALSASQTFSWDHPAFTPRPALYRVRAGTLGPGSSNLGQNTVTPSGFGRTSLTLSGMPAAPIPVFVTFDAQYTSIDGWHSVQNFVYNTTPGNGNGNVIPGTVTLTTNLPPGWSIPVVPGQARIFTSVTVGGNYGGPVRISCSGMAGVSCGPVVVPAATTATTVPLVVTASAGVAVGAGMLNIVAKGDPDEAVKASVAAPAKTVSGSDYFQPLDVTETYADNQRRHFPDWIWGGSGPAPAVQYCQMSPVDSRIDIQPYVNGNELALSIFVSDGVSPGSYRFDCLKEATGATAFEFPQYLRVRPLAKLDDLDPASGEAGQTLELEITGSFDRTQVNQVKIEGPGITVLTTGATDASDRLTRTISIAADAPVGSRSVWVENPPPPRNSWVGAAWPNGKSNTLTFQVQPSTLGIKMFRGSTEVTNRRVAVKAGERVSLSISLPAGLTATSYAWTIPPSLTAANDGFDEPFSQYAVTPVAARVVGALGLDQPSVSFYWSGEYLSALPVSCKVFLAGRDPITVFAHFIVRRPRVSPAFASIWGSVNVGSWYRYPGRISAYFGGSGPGIPGIRFDFSQQAGFDPSDQFQWVQVSKIAFLQKQFDSDGVHFSRLDPSYLGSYYLDTIYPYTTVTSITETTDSPATVGLDQQEGVLSHQRQQEFVMYLMYRPSVPGGPSESSWVPLSAVQWSWAVAACRVSPTVWAKSAFGVPSPTHSQIPYMRRFPTWEDRISSDILVFFAPRIRTTISPGEDKCPESLP